MAEQFQSLQEIKTFVEGIPAEKFIKFSLYNEGTPLDGKRCVMGHILEHITGKPRWPLNLSINLAGGSVYVHKLVEANNADGDSKQNVLNYLNSLN